MLIPAVQSLPESSRTRRINAINTVERTQIFPVYLRLYEEDMSAIDQNVDAAPQELDHFSWFFVCYAFGQRHELRTGESLGAGSFRLEEIFDQRAAPRTSVHIALNFRCTDGSFSLFWVLDRTYSWMKCEFVFR